MDAIPVVDLAKAQPVFSPERLPSGLRDLGARFLVWGDRVDEKPWPSKTSPTHTVRKWSKKPIGATSSAPETWIDFDAALATRERANACGVGYATLNGPLTAIDLDHVLDARGKPFAPYRPLVELLCTLAYVERSPSGRGLRALLRGAEFPAESFAWYEGEKTPDDRNKRGVEVYGPDSTRYVTLTGDRWAGSRREIGMPTAKQSAALARQVDALRARKARFEGEAAPAAPATAGGRGPAELACRLHAKGYLGRPVAPRPKDGATWFKLTECLHPACDSQTGGRVGITSENDLLVLCHNAGCPMNKSRDGHERERREAAQALDALLKWTPRTNGNAAHLDLSPFSEIESKLVEWIWRAWLAVAVVTLIAGQQGIGKSYLLAYLVACLTRGRTLPDGRSRAPRCIVLYCTSEDDLETTIKPRLAQFDADERYVVPVERSNVTGEPAAWLRGAIDGVRKRAPRRPMIVIFDALDSFLQVEDANSSGDVRPRLDALLAIAREKRVAVIGVKHLNKRTTEAEPLYRISGTSAYTEVPRIIWRAEKDEIRRGHVVVETIKCNIGPALQHFEILDPVRRPRGRAARGRLPGRYRARDRRLQGAEALQRPGRRVARVAPAPRAKEAPRARLEAALRRAAGLHRAERKR